MSKKKEDADYELYKKLNADKKELEKKIEEIDNKIYSIETDAVEFEEKLALEKLSEIKVGYLVKYLNDHHLITAMPDLKDQSECLYDKEILTYEIYEDAIGESQITVSDFVENGVEILEDYSDTILFKLLVGK